MKGVDNAFLRPALQTPLSFCADIVLTVPACRSSRWTGGEMLQTTRLSLRVCGVVSDDDVFFCPFRN